MRGVVITTLLVLAVLSACFAASAPKAEATIDETSAVEETPEIASEAEFEDSEDDLEERSLEEDDIEEFDESDLDERSVEEEELEDESADQDVDETAEQEVDEEEEADTNEMSTADDETEESSEDDNEAAIEVVKDAHRRWVCYHRKCYRVFTCHYRWYQAYRVCRRYGGNLVSIHNCYQNRIVRAYARRYGNLWIGLNDRRCEGRFRWTDRSRYNFRRWYCREPNNYRNEDCVEMYRNGRWNDLRCCNRRRFMCQRRRRRHCHWHHWHRHHHWG
ncbi:low affinity immunoglobulin epsilon Fc receptor-like [Ptychodera flava]|uniref:low affinity immunoglobulin epsilon Fc receptor-like n=1 Tax=Ptychodera flava TaxID=63121 RepID=UPI00396A30DE